MRRFFMAALTLLLAGCDNMADQAKKEALEASSFSADGASARLPPRGTVPRESLADPVLRTGMGAADYVTRNPLQPDMGMLMEGRTLFGIHCAVCHGSMGEGDGIIVQRGFPTPPSYHTERLRAAPDGYLFRVITDGYGAMYPYGGRVSPKERWKIIAYIRALQFSRHAPATELPEELRPRGEDTR